MHVRHLKPGSVRGLFRPPCVQPARIRARTEEPETGFQASSLRSHGKIKIEIIVIIERIILYLTCVVSHGLFYTFTFFFF